tara:strand:- start:380 stop:1192 length:813 start_codon:yes stop_codon:yes gene_type:complete
MSQHDYVINNDSGASVRSDLNSALQAILSQNSGTSAPSSTSAGTMWLDTTGGAPYTLKIRDAGNNHWLTIGSVTDPGSDGNLSVSAIEGSNVLSTGESGGTKFLREDGDGSCSFQNLSASSFLDGQIIQTVSATSNTQVTQTSTSFNNISSLEVQITPLLASSDIYLMVTSTGYATNASDYALYDFYKNASDVTETNNLSGQSDGFTAIGNGSGTVFASLNYMFRDTCSENSLSTKTYRPSMRVWNSGGTSYFGWSNNATSSLHAFEVKR